jgi:hypothetical protein
MGLKIWSLSNPGIEPATFLSLRPKELTNSSNRAHKAFRNFRLMDNKVDWGFNAL